MALSFSSAQSRGYELDIVFMSQNLYFISKGLEYNNEFASKCEISATIGSLLPSVLFEYALDEVFDYAYVDDPGYSDPDVVVIRDELLRLISSGKYKDSKMMNQIDNALFEIGLSISYDIDINVPTIEMNEFEEEEIDLFSDLDLNSEEYGLIIEKLIIDDTLTFKLYNTEELPMVLESLEDLRDVLIQIKEEFHAKNH